MTSVKEKIAEKEWRRYVQTMISAGIIPIGKHKAAKLLALCLAFGDEPFVFNEKLYRDVMTAAMAYGIGPMKIPDDEVARLINGYYHTLAIGCANWVEEINKSYGTDFRNQMESDGRNKLPWQSMRI